MKNQRGFIASSVLYVMLGLFLSLMIGVMAIYSNRKVLLDRIKEDVVSELEADLKSDHSIGQKSDYYRAAQTYINLNASEFSSFTTVGAKKLIKVNDLIDAGLLPQNIVSPHTKRKEILENNYIGVTVTDEGYTYIYVDNASATEFIG